MKSTNLMEKYFLDDDTHIHFPHSIAYKELPAGIYYPDTDRQNRLLLKKVSPLSGSLQFNPYAKKGNEMTFTEADLIELEQALLEIDEENNGRTSLPKDELVSSNENIDGMNRIRQLDYLQEGYFPMQEWNKGLKKIDDSIKVFLKSRKMYEQNKLGYRRSVLLFGKPGTGKSRYIDNLTKELIAKENAVVIRLDSYSDLTRVAEHGIITLEAFLTNRLKVFVIEELAVLLRRTDYTSVLNFLDNAIMRSNVMFLMTTNTPEIIPDALIDRPSRIDVLEEVGIEFKDGFIEAWYKHITGKELPDSEKSASWYRSELTPAYLKELFLVSAMHSIPIEDAWSKIDVRRKLINSNFQQTREVGFGI